MNHPDLFAGFNTAPNNGDEVDGAGVNYPPVSPNWVNTMTEIPILIVTEDLMQVFGECPDLVIPGEVDTIVFPSELETLVIRGSKAA